MPHLPPVEITGGSLFIDIPLKQRRPDKEILFRSVETPEREFPSWKDLPVHSEESEPYPESHHVHDPVQYKVQRYAAADETTSIYLIEIYGEDETEILEFRPKGKKCSVKIYYAGADEDDEVRKLMQDRRWPRPDFAAERLASESHD